VSISNIRIARTSGVANCQGKGKRAICRDLQLPQ